LFREDEAGQVPVRLPSTPVGPPAADGADQPRRAQRDRSAATQRRLLDATVDCLVDVGWSGTTTTLVAERAGVSRGAQLHHYPTKDALVLAAVAHLIDRRAAELTAEASTLPALPGRERVNRVVDLLAASFTGPLFAAALELWVAARTDPQLRDALVSVEAQFGRDLHRLAVRLLGAEESRPGVRQAVQSTLDLLRGLGVANLLTDDAPRREALLASWKDTLFVQLYGAQANERNP
jgi:AcrR family transcriptional regulator